MIILGTNSIKDTGYNVDNSARFDGTTAYLNRTPGSASNRKTFTFSTWIKRSGTSGVTVHQDIFSSDAGDDESYIHFDTDSLKIFSTLPSSAGGAAGDPACVLITTQKFRDFSAWFHIVVAVDTTQGTASNRVKLYINGTQVTSFSTETYPDQDYQFATNAAVAHMIARRPAGSKFLPGYLAETVLIDGSQLAPDQFGEFDEDSVIWKPIDVSGLTFGTNGFYLDFEDSSALGNDVSGNDNDFTVNNLTAIDQSTDTCTNNFATLNPLSTPATLSEGNLKGEHGGSGTYATASSTIGMTSGKWYCEAKLTTVSSNYPATGICSTDSNEATKLDGADWLGRTSNSYGMYTDSGQVYNNGSVVSTFSSASSGDIIGLALDLDSATNTLKYYKNGTLIGTQNITTNSNGWFFAKTNQSGRVVEFNFGSPPFTISSGNTDGNGYGNFEYAVPSGYYALNTKNLAEYG